MEEINLCGRPNKCCPKLVITGKLLKKYTIVDDNGTKINLTRTELVILGATINKKVGVWMK
jgi:hypothetical protein